MRSKRVWTSTTSVCGAPIDEKAGGWDERAKYKVEVERDRKSSVAAVDDEAAHVAIAYHGHHGLLSRRFFSVDLNGVSYLLLVANQRRPGHTSGQHSSTCSP